MRRLFSFGAAILMGSASGLGSALWLAGLWPAGSSLAFGDVEVDDWLSDFAIGSEAANPYTRARVARHGLLALAKTEAVYFTRAVDDTGAPLREACTYRLTGGAMPAGWWSVTLYDGQSMLPANTDGALSVDASRVGEGVWEAVIAPVRPEGAVHWISSRNAGTFDLTLRLYMPDAALLTAPKTALRPPKIEQVTCKAGL
jgi:hypothetical protein